MGAAGGVAICPKTSCGRRAMQIARRSNLASEECRGLWALLCEHRALSLRPLRSKALNRREPREFAECAEKAGSRVLMLQEWDISPVRLWLWLWLRPDWLQVRRAFANVAAASHRSLQSRHWKESQLRLRAASQGQSAARCHRPPARCASGGRGLVAYLRATLNPAARLLVWHQT